MWAVLTLVLVALPLLAAWAVAHRRGGFDAAEAFILAALAWTAFAVCVALVLSVGAGPDLFEPRSGHLARAGLLLFWVPAALLSALALWRERDWISRLPAAASLAWGEASTRARVIAGITLAGTLIIGLVAVIAAPNNWDSMTYHLARVASWLQLGGVRQYATTVEPQLYQPPGAEMLIVQLQAMAGGDRLDALVQWFAYCGSMAVVWLAAARLGGSRFAQLLAVFLVGTMPMAMMQGASTQNDLVLSFWLLCAAALALGPRAGRDGALRFAAACLALGFAILTKGTALILGFPVGLLVAGALAYAVIRGERSIGRAAALAAAGLLLILAPNISHWHQNHETFGDYVATGSTGNFYKTASPGPATIFSNIVRNSALEAKLPGSGPSSAVERGSRGLLDALGINPDDPSNTFAGQLFQVDQLTPQEDHASNLALLILGIWAAVAMLASSRLRTRRRLAWIAVVTAQVLLFSALLRWQPWNARLHLPMFVMIAPLVAVYLAQWRRQHWVTAAVVLIAIPLPVYWFYSYTRPLVGERSILTTPRDQQYFTPRPYIAGSYTQASAVAAKAPGDTVGLVSGIDSWTYPFWPLQPAPGKRIGGVLVYGPSKKYAGDERPQVVICVQCGAAEGAELTSQGYRTLTLPPPPVDHDPRLTEVPVTVSVWRLRGAQVASASASP